MTEQELRSEAIVLDDQYLHHLREAAYDWAIESVEDQPAGPRRAAIVLGRNVVSLVDEVRQGRAERDALQAQLQATRTLAAAGLGRQLHLPPSEPPAPGQVHA